MGVKWSVQTREPNEQLNNLWRGCRHTMYTLAIVVLFSTLVYNYEIFCVVQIQDIQLHSWQSI